MAKPIYVLGTGLSHDGSSCLLRDGKIVVAIEKERLTRKKHDGFNDTLTLQYCLDAEGITWDEVDLLVENNTINIYELEDQRRRGERRIPLSVPRVNISHHLAHAYSAIGPSPFDEATVIVMDGRGSSLDNCVDLDGAKLPSDIERVFGEERSLWWEKESLYSFQAGRLRTVYKDFSRLLPDSVRREEYPMRPHDTAHSIAEFYGGVTEFVFNDEWAQGKLMGLAPYGSSGRYSYEGIDLRGNRAFINYEWMKNFRYRDGGKFNDLRDKFQYYADIAYWAQQETERAVQYMFEAYRQLAPSKNVAYAGGLALNAVSNATLFSKTRFDRFYFQPASGDNGISIGCCYYGWMEVLGRRRVPHDGRSAFGRQYSRDEICAALRMYGQDLLVEEVHNTGVLLNRVAVGLADGQVLGWFQGPSEFGPRALGHRSILADPRRAEMTNFINANVKFREDFRPFAPSVTVEDAATYFDCDYESPYMILVARARPEWRDRIPAVVHRDGSSRLQTVDRSVNPRYHALLKSFEGISGLPVLLNTSFNWRGMPIVETPTEALRMVTNCALHGVVLEDFLVVKK